MRIDIVSDTICPWCFIGKRRLERALAENRGLEAEITWRPFQLNPDMPEGGLDRASYLEAKFGGPERAREIYGAIRAAGEQEGLPFDFERIAKTPNTLNSHRLIHWAGTAGCQDAVVERLFELYFFEGADVSDHEVLVAVAREAGMDADMVADLLAKGSDLELVREEDMAARRMGIQGVPYFIIENKYAVSGAQDPQIFKQVFDLIQNRQDEAQASAEAGAAAGD